MDVAIIGAGGAIGRQVAIALVTGCVLGPSARLQLVGRPGGASEQTLPGLAHDLLDAHAEIAPQIETTASLEDVVADIVILCAGDTAPATPTGNPDRSALARQNRPLAAAVAKHLADTGHGEELLLVVTNPVEVTVRSAAEYLPRKRVIGMGGHLDSLRFRGEIAAQLGVRRQSVQALVLGEHGLGLVPCWSTLSVYGFEHPGGRQRLAALPAANAANLPAATGDLLAIQRDQGTTAAYAALSAYDAGARTFLRPVVTHCSGARTPVGSAAMIVELVGNLVSGRHTRTAAQVVLEGEFLDIHGVTGVPVLVTNRGIEHIEALPISASEAEAVRQAAARSQALWEASA